MTATNTDVARSYFRAVQNGDLETVGKLLDEHVIWHQPGANRFSGVRRGRDDVFRMLGGMMEVNQGSFSIERVHALMGNGQLVAATIRFAGRRDEASMAMDGVDLLRMENGKIVEAWLFSGDQAAEDAFWGK
ncbi:ketosteroid isomerase [Streptomyces solincola]|uniref:Ketosteroid isomerase n=1 Tax=Streptomyces solincola TaxID=2100817 RepID=A0A2S9PZQ4_9ACTN|nr:nuclear transport factor 2 family protein [Streptomyces solincola]PRH79910.1 ketosteroid isomerase [Streptomyces solincola]